jgi:predicted alpha/beta hydrolase family esterase
MNYLIVHGAGGSPQGNWFPWLQDRLAPVPVRVPRFPTPEGQTLSAWLDIADNALAGWPPENTVLVGHSSGALLVLRLAERAVTPYKAVFAICPFARALDLPEFDPLNASFVHPGFDWEAVSRGAQSITCFAGDNDPYVPLAYSQEVAKACGAELVVIPGGGHLNAEAGRHAFPELLQRLKSID